MLHREAIRIVEHPTLADSVRKQCRIRALSESHGPYICVLRALQSLQELCRQPFQGRDTSSPLHISKPVVVMLPCLPC